MARYKGAPIVIARARLRDLGADAEELVRSRLSPDARRTLDTLVATSWVPIAHAEEIYRVAAPVLHPNVRDAPYALGADLGHEMLNGVYRFVARVVSVPFLVAQTATLWGRFHDTGLASSEQTASRTVVFRVREHPMFPPTIRRTVTGWLASAIERTGAQNVRVIDGGSPACWEWTATWR